ncbi:MAG TPA: adenylosuccinate lyase [Terrimicrobium sp.]
MIDRYSLPQMRSLWSEQRKLEIWLEIEILACEAMADLGSIPREDAATIRGKAAFEIANVREIEKRTNHDVIAFLEDVASRVGPASRWVHQGLTSSDLLDTTLAVQMNSACAILLDDLNGLRGAIGLRAIEHKFTPMIGRSHGVHAEPITFGLKLALMFDEFSRATQRLVQMRERIRVGKISGAVGTHAHLDPRVEKFVCERLGLKAAALSTQIIQRDRHAEFLSVLALIASSVDRWATEFRHLQRTEVLEVEEYFAEGQKGSSAMPHKRNPITGERLSGIARVIRGHAVAAFENIVLWHERDISHSSVERIILPDSSILLDYMLVTLRKLIDGLQVYPENMKRNMEITRGLYASQSALLMLTEKGLDRKMAYEAVQHAAMKTWAEKGSFAENLAAEPTVAKFLTAEDIADACSTDRHFRYIEDKFRAVGIAG